MTVDNAAARRFFLKKHEKYQLLYNFFCLFNISIDDLCPIILNRSIILNSPIESNGFFTPPPSS